MPLFKIITRLIMGLLYIAAGAYHLVDPSFYMKIMPPYLPWHWELVIISGIAEMALGVLVMIPRTSRLGAWGLIALLIAIFPANLHMALHPEQFSTIPPMALYGRLPMQVALIAWAYVYTRRT